MKLQRLFPIAFLAIALISCDTNNDPNIDVPAKYEFTRNSESTVTFSGQTTRIQMATELVGAMNEFETSSKQLLLQMFRNQTADGGDANPYQNADLNAATKSIKSKIAASSDYFSANTTLSADLKDQFETWMISQIEDVYPNRRTLAAPSQPGQIADGSRTRYVNGKGFEYNQLVAKGLIGALMADQIMNNYISTSVLDAGTNTEDNSNGNVSAGANYTSMEHKWDEAYGYLYGNAIDPADPLPSVGDSDHFLNNYLGSVEEDEDFAGISEETFDAFKLGRAAIVAAEYDVRDEQAQIIRKNLSTVIAVRAVYYLQSGKEALSQSAPDYGTAFHDLSEGYGFVFSLQFTRVPNSDSPYLTKADVDRFRTQLEEGNGLWDVSPETLDSISAEIAEQFNFTIEEAAN